MLNIFLATNKFVSIFFLILFFNSAYSQSTLTSTELYEKLIRLPDIVSVAEIEAENGYDASFEIFISQPFDHISPGSGNFNQKFYLSHRDENLPMVIELDGYSITFNRPNELADLLHCNKIVVEHRYFGESTAENPEWKYLTIEQAANDHHKIISILKNIYYGKWIGTGISKGGQTTIFHRYFFNDDVDVSVAYVAPLCLSQEDPRIYSFLNSVGTEDCRTKMIEFQREVLNRYENLIPMLKNYAEEKGYTYSLGNDRFIFEYIVLEYGFAFWQWQNVTCDEIPSTDSEDEVLFDHLQLGSSFSYFADHEIASVAPFYYQAYSELGYYGYDISALKDLLIEVKEPTSKIFLPEGVDPEFNCVQANKINSWLQKKGNNFIFIYGEVDTWSAPAVQLTGETNSIKMICKNGSHKTRINSFDEPEREIILNTLENWLDYNIPE
jgi:hypothetical protein